MSTEVAAALAYVTLAAAESTSKKKSKKAKKSRKWHKLELGFSPVEMQQRRPQRRDAPSFETQLFQTTEATDRAYLSLIF